MRFIASLLIVIVFFSCEEAGTIGEAFIGEDVLDVVRIDSIDVRLSTFKFDSLNTTGSGRLLVGKHQDDSLGLVSSKSYFRLDAETISGDPGENSVFISAEFQLFYDGYFYYDTLDPIELSIYHLAEELKFDDDAFYNVDTVGYFLEDTFLTASFIPRPNRDEMISLEVKDIEFVTSIFNYLKNDNYDFIEFLEGFSNGFVLSSEESESNGPFLGFNSESRLLFNYREGQDEKEFFISIDDALQFNQIVSNRSGTSISELRDQDNPILASTSGNGGYLQNGVGIALKFEFPNMKEVREIIRAEDVYRADLELVPALGSLSNITPISNSFDFTLVDNINRIEQQLSPFPTLLFVDKEFNQNTLFTIDVTEYIRFELERESTIQNGVLMTQPELSNSVDRIYIDDDQFNTILKLYIFQY